MPVATVLLGAKMFFGALLKGQRVGQYRRQFLETAEHATISGTTGKSAKRGYVGAPSISVIVGLTG